MCRINGRIFCKPHLGHGFCLFPLSILVGLCTRHKHQTTQTTGPISIAAFLRLGDKLTRSATINIKQGGKTGLRICWCHHNLVYLLSLLDLGARPHSAQQPQLLAVRHHCSWLIGC